MNKKYLLKIPVKDLAGEEVVKDKVLNLSINTLLTPMYVTEGQLLSMFVEDEDRYYLKAREIAFTSSLRARDYLEYKLQSLNLPEGYTESLVRELAQCFGVNGLATALFKTFGESVSRSKTLGEFSVSTSIKHSTHALRDIMNSSRDCVDEAKKAVDELKHLAASYGRATSKASCHPSSRFSYRLWFHNNLPERSDQIYASEKYRHYDGNIYKDGIRGGTYVPNTRTPYS